MADCMIDRGQRVGAAAPRLIISDGTTSHLTRLANNAGLVIGYVFCLLSSVLCFAEDLPDPTRPPASIFAPVGGAGVAHEMPAENHARGLHTIIISETRRAAIIDGQTVELGEEHSGARLIEVNEGGVVLERGQSRQVLPLFPDIKIIRKKTPAKE